MSVPLSFRKLARDVLRGVGQKDPEQQRSMIAKFLERVKNLSGHGRQMAWLSAEHPAVFEYVTTVVPEFDLSDPNALQVTSKGLQRFINAKLGQTQWDEHGYSLYYARVSRALLGLKEEGKYDFFVERDGEPRFRLTTDAWSELLPGTQGIIRDDYIESYLKELGVERPDVKHQAGGFLGVFGRTYDVEPPDAALMIDAYEPTIGSLPRRGKHLMKKALRKGWLKLGQGGFAFGNDSARDRINSQWRFVRREHLSESDVAGGAATKKNIFVMPAGAYRSMRGVEDAIAADALGREPTAEEIAAKVRERLDARGIEKPDVHAREIEGQESIVVPTRQARLLLQPIDIADDVATRWTETRIYVNPEAVGLCRQNALAAVEGSVLAYEQEGVIQKYTAKWGFVDDAGQATAVRFEEPSVGAEGFACYRAEDNTIFISLTGSDDFRDWRANADTDLVDGSLYGGGQVCEGFHGQFVALRAHMEKAVERFAALAQAKADGPPPKIVIGGHSLGGALAGLFTRYWLNKLKTNQTDIPIKQVYTCGQPAFGDPEFTATLRDDLDRFGVNYVRIVNENDPVVDLPAGVDHDGVGVEYVFNEHGEFAGERKDDGKDKSIFDVLGSTWEGIKSGFSRHFCRTYLGVLRKCWQDMA